MMCISIDANVNVYLDILVLRQMLHHGKPQTPGIHRPHGVSLGADATGLDFLGFFRGIEIGLTTITRLHHWKSRWNPKIEIWKMILLFKQVIFRFHVNFSGRHWFELINHMWFLALAWLETLSWKCSYSIAMSWRVRLADVQFDTHEYECVVWTFAAWTCNMSKSNVHSTSNCQKNQTSVLFLFIPS